MKSFLLIGLGRFGRHMAMKLDELNHQVMAVDLSEERVNAVLPYATNAQIGDGTNEDFIQSLGVSNYDVCVVAIGDDFQSSLETTALLKECGAKFVVARAARDVQAKFLLKNGADDVVYPEKMLGIWSAIRYSADHIFDYIEVNKDNAIFEVAVPHNWLGKTVEELDIRNKYNFTVIGVKEDGVLNANVSPSTVFKEENTILVLGNIKQIYKCFHI